MRTLVYTNANGLSLTLSSRPYMITKIDGLGSPGLGLQEKFAPYQDGSTLIDQLYQPRDLTVEFALAAVPSNLSGIATARRTIVSALNPKTGIGLLTFTNDYGTWQIPAIPASSPIFANRVSTEPYQQVQVVFHCPNPYWQSTTQSTASLSYLGSSLEFPAAGLDMLAGGIEISSLGTLNGSVTNLTNGGDVDCPITLRFYGPATNPKVINNTTGFYIRIVKVVASGDYFEFNTTFGQKTVTMSISGTLSSGMQYLDLNSTFFQLQPGVNQLQFVDEGSTAGSTATIAYRTRYIGV